MTFAIQMEKWIAWSSLAREEIEDRQSLTITSIRQMNVFLFVIVSTLWKTVAEYTIERSIEIFNVILKFES